MLLYFTVDSFKWLVVVVEMPTPSWKPAVGSTADQLLAATHMRPTGCSILGTRARVRESACAGPSDTSRMNSFSLEPPLSLSKIFSELFHGLRLLSFLVLPFLLFLPFQPEASPCLSLPHTVVFFTYSLAHLILPRYLLFGRPRYLLFGRPKLTQMTHRVVWGNRWQDGVTHCPAGK